MENKSNSLNKIKRQQREKVLRFSIRKYSFGAASVAVAALMFLGARVASADSVVENTSSSTAGAASPKNEAESPLGITASTENKVEVANNSLENKESAIVENSGDTVDKSQLRTVVEELNSLLSAKLNLDDSVLSSVKERVQKGQVLLDKADAVQKDINELKELLSTDLAILSTAVKESSEVRESNTETEAENPVSESSSEVRTSEENQTVSAKKDSLKVSVDQLQAPVLELPEHETSKDVLEKANELIGLAQGVLENTTVSLNDVEDMKKRVKRMARGTQFRAYTATSSSGSLKNVKYFASVDKNTNGGSYLRNDDPEFTEKKTVIKAKYEQNSSGKWMVYDVYFNNNGVAMVERSYSQHYYFQPPFNIMDSSNKVENLTFTRYRNLDGNPDRKLSDGGSGFQKVGETATISYPWVQRTNVFPGDRRSTYDPQGVSRANQKWQVFKHNQDDLYLDKIVKRTDGSYTGRVSYTLGLEVGRTDLDYAIHMTARVKLKDNVTETEAANGNVYAASVTTGPTTNQSYIVGSQGTSLQAKPDASLYPIKGKEITKIVGESLGDVSNPVSSGFVVRNNDTKDFPGGMRWNWTNEQPNTSAAGIFQYNVTATYSDNSSNSTTATLKVKPIKPTITANDVVHKKGLTNQTITVNVGAGVKTGSTVTLYSDGKVIGTGKTNGTTARITVEGPLTGSPITAETTVNNNGTVKSDRSNPVTPTDAPDTQPPTLTVTPAEQTVKVGEKILFNVNGQDDTKVNLNFSDIFKKYADHLFTQKTNYSVNTDKQKTLSINLGAAKETDIGEKTVTFKATDDAGHETVKTVKVKVVPATKENATHNPTATELRVGINHQLTDDQIKAKVAGYPTNATLVVEEKPETNTTGAKTAKVKVIYSDKSEDQVDVPIIVRDTTPPKIYWAKDDGSKVELGKTHEQGQSIVIPLYRGDAVNTRLITTDDSGKVTNFKMENLQSGFNFTPVNGTATEGSPLGQNVTGTVGLGVAKGKYTARAISTDGTNSTTGHFVFEVHEQAEKYTPAANTLTVLFNHTITDDEVKGKVIAKPGTPAFPNGTIFEVVSKPETNTTGTDKKAVVKITYPDKSTENIDVPVHVGKDLASQHPLEGKTVTVTVGDSLKVWDGRVDSNRYTNAPKGRGNGVQWGWKGTAPKVVQDTAGVFKYTATATHTDKSVAESNPQVTVIVKPKAPTIETDLTGKAELPNTAVVVNVHNGVKDGSIVTLYSQDGRAIGTGTVANGKAIITGTIPKGNITARTTVQTPGEQDVTSDPSPEKVATTNKAALYPIKGKTATVTVGDSLRSWKGRVDANQYTDAGPNGKGIGVEWGWEGTAPKILQDTAGVFKYTATATHTDKTVAKSNPQVTIIVKPKAPTIETDLTGKSNQENVPVTVSVGGGVKDGSIVTLYGPDETTVIGTGTVTNGKATVIITGKVPVGNITAKTTVQTSGQDDVVSEPSPIKEATNIVPTAKTQTVGHKEQPIAKNSIGNNGDLPNGTNYTWKTIPDTSTPGDKPGIVTVTYPDGSTIDIPVTVTVTPQKDAYTPTPVNQTVGLNKIPEAKNSIGNKNNLPNGTTYVWKETPDTSSAGDKPAVVLVTYPDKTVDEVPVTVKVTQVSDEYTPKYEDGNGKPGTKVEIPLTEENGKKIPTGTTFESDQPGVITVDDKGKVTVTIPKEAKPGNKITGKVTVTYPDGSKEEVPVTVTVGEQDKDIYTPKYNDGNGKPGTKVEIPLTEENGKKIPTGTTFESDQPGVITVDKDGKVTVTIPADKNPGDKITGKVTVTYPDGSKEEVPVKVTVTTPARKTPTVELSQDPTTGDVTVTPKKPDGSTYPEGTIVELPGKDGRPIKVTIGADGSAKVPNDQLPDTTVVGNAKITEPGKAAVEVPNVTTPAKVTVSTEQPSKSHNVLPNTGTESNATLASLGLLGMLSGLGFAFRKKKED
ncbi:Rib/alpha-like domain-containing protein [Streptococcus pseudopneumoniae]|uniref:Rib/alpha-like domain-containing protein n=1 Tax=Streptococcus pseudopneumoniae TaxID=257758 RepID=UPI00061CD40B|nr:Rib/alpha-like domain-containing protein [Streptococcus pseudopneumoniae]COO22134.1 putative cell wall/surface protein [Streptococcus pseudopneumoniae]